MHKIVFALYCLLLTVLLAGCSGSTEAPPSAVVNGPHASAADAHRIPRGDLNFVEGFQAGYEKGLREHKPMLVFFTADWCSLCHEMADEAFTNEQVVSLSRDFVCVLVDYDAEPSVDRQFLVRACPTIQFLSPRGVPLKRIAGKQLAHVLAMEMQSALQNVARLAEADQAVTPR